MKQKTATVRVRLTPEVHRLIAAAAQERGQSIEDFMATSALKEASGVQSVWPGLTLSAEQFAAFEAALDTPSPPTAKLKRLMASRTPWK